MRRSDAAATAGGVAFGGVGGEAMAAEGLAASSRWMTSP